MIYSLGDIRWGYICFLMGLLFSLLFILDSIFLWLYKASVLPTFINIRMYRIVVVAISIFGVWGGSSGYQEFSKIKFSNETILIEYLWPKPNIKIPFSQLSRYEIKIPPKVPENRRVIIYLKNGKKYKSIYSDPGYRDSFDKILRELDKILRMQT